MWREPQVAEGALAAERRHNAFDDALSDVLGVVNASSARLVDLVRQCLDAGTWQVEGCRSPEHWVAARCGLGAARAAKLVRIARRIHEFPLVEAQARAGLVTEDHLSVITDRAHADHDPALADCASIVNVAQLRRVIRSLPVPDVEPAPDPNPNDADQPGDDANLRDRVSFGWGDDGRFRANVEVGPELGGLLDKAWRAARSRLFRERTGADPDDEDAAVERIGAVATLERLAHAALDGLDPDTARGARPSERYQALLHLPIDRPDTARIHLGPVLDETTRRYLDCDCDIRLVIHSGGRPVSMGRRQRVVDPLLRALIEERDDGCIVCGAQGFLHIHHLWHWEDGGPTDDDNLVAMCTTCHRAIHAGRLTIVGDPIKPGGLIILGPTGVPLPRPSPTELRALEPADCAYRGPDRSGRWRASPFDRDETAAFCVM